jgi:DNA-binding FadR family transcriptional regulator
MRRLHEEPPEGEHIYQRTVVAQVMEKIKDLLTSGLYKVGDRIPTEQELAERFGIGRSSIREAIKIFQYLGILESRVPKGTFLSDRSHISTEAITWSVLLGDDDMWEIIELRQVIEERAFVALLSRYGREPKAVEGVIAELENEVKNMKIAADEKSLDKLIGADYNFHAVIIREGGNKLFWAIYRTLHSFMREEIRKTYQGMKNLSDVSLDHREIIDVIRAGDEEKAAARHSSHFLRIKGLLTPGLHPKI